MVMPASNRQQSSCPTSEIQNSKIRVSKKTKEKLEKYENLRLCLVTTSPRFPPIFPWGSLLKEIGYVTKRGNRRILAKRIPGISSILARIHMDSSVAESSQLPSVPYRKGCLFEKRSLWGKRKGLLGVMERKSFFFFFQLPNFDK